MGNVWRFSRQALLDWLNRVNADVLVSLDQKHIVPERVKRGFPLRVTDTKEFFQELTREEQGNG